MEYATTFDTQTKDIQNDETLVAAPQSVDKDLNDVTFTFEVQSEANTTQTDRLPITSLHVLEEISPNEQTHVADLDNGQDAAVSMSEHDALQTQHTATDSMDEAEIVIPIVQFAAHPSRNIQNGMDLWARIREYDKRTAEEGFIQVLSKKQQQILKKQVLGQPHYKTRAKGGATTSSQ